MTMFRISWTSSGCQQCGYGRALLLYMSGMLGMGIAVTSAPQGLSRFGHEHCLQCYLVHQALSGGPKGRPHPQNSGGNFLSETPQILQSRASSAASSNAVG